MDLAYVFSNDKGWLEKIQGMNQDIKSLSNVTRDMMTFISHLSNDEIEDFVYRLKLCHEKSKGKEVDVEQDSKMVARISIQYGPKNYFFKLAPSDTGVKKNESLFYCESCGLSTTMRNIKIKPHIKAFHSS